MGIDLTDAAGTAGTTMESQHSHMMLHFMTGSPSHGYYG